MKALYQDLPFPKDSYINFYKEDLPSFIVPWHFHPEIEIMHITEGFGTRFVGDDIGSYEAGDICMIGSGLQHEWRNDKVFARGQTELRARCNVLFFRREVFEQNMIYLPEMTDIRELIERSQRGILFYGDSRKTIEAKIREVHPRKGVSRITGLLELLELMAGQKQYRLLASIGFADSINSEDFDRFNKVYAYLVRNYTSPVSLTDAASLIGMTPQGFCNYFKKRTGTSFTRYLNGMRIGAARKMLLHGKFKISVICSEVGFNNMSNFIEQFKKYTHMSPVEYQYRYGVKNRKAM